MENNRRRQVVLLVALGAVFAALIAWQLRGSSSPAPGGSPADTRRAQPAPRRDAADEVVAPDDVKLDELEAKRATPLDGGRNPFSFRPAPPPPPPPPPPALPGGPGGAGGPGGPGGGDAAMVPAGPPPPPPITLKFIGVVVRTGGATKIAVLSDGKFVYHGREGDIIEGRFRVVKIGEESIQMEYADGRGRQTIRLTGS